MKQGNFYKYKSNPKGIFQPDGCYKCIGWEGIEPIMQDASGKTEIFDGYYKACFEDTKEEFVPELPKAGSYKCIISVDPFIAGNTYDVLDCSGYSVQLESPHDNVPYRMSLNTFKHSFSKDTTNVNNRLKYLGLTDCEERSYNVGKSDYSKHFIQPWSIILDYNLNYWDGDIIKRVLRTKEGEDRITDYEKIIHICKERIRQIKNDKLK